MRSLLLIAAVLVTGALALGVGQQCEPGSTFKLDCNTCRCSADGKLMSCTRKFCVPEEQGDDPQVQTAAAAVAKEVSGGDALAEKEEEVEHANKQVCTPNETKQEDCNRCKCAANGIGWFCTRNACPPRERRSAADSANPASKCEPGTSFKHADGCNTCHCGPNGVAACTAMYCFNSKTKRDVSAQPAPATKQECVPGTNFRSADGCNSCFCTETGVAACTMKFCYTPKQKRDVEQPAKKQCEPGTTYHDGCNNCFCTEDGVAACTQKLCLTTVPKSKRDVAQPAKQCEPGTSFKSSDGCNDCFCTDNGMAACTMKFCFFEEPATKTKRETPQKLEKQCEPGTSYKSSDGCNDCFCTDNGIAACTMKFCFFEEPATKTKRETPQKVEKQCEPGTSFKSSDGCNDCFCTETGIAACTMKFCFNEPLPVVKSKRQTQNEELPVSEVAPGTPGFTCNAGKSFKYQCNTCRCDTTGQSAACTFKFCIPGEY